MSVCVRKLLLPSALFSVLAVFSQWSFFDVGVTALGFNSTVVLCFFWLVVHLNWRQNQSSSKDWAWILPLWIIAGSFGLYENPWLKTHCVWLLPLITGFVLSYRVLPNGGGYFFGSKLLLFLLKRSLMPLSNVGRTSVMLRKKFLGAFGYNEKHVLLRVFVGVLILVPLATIILFLLQAADQVFSDALILIFEQLGKLFSFEYFWQLLATLSLFIVFVSSNLVWNAECRYISKGENIHQLDSVTTGTVVGGILLIYVLFVYLQVDQLFVGNLPEEFERAVVYVKTGFWQLIVLSIINAVLFLWVYKKTGRRTQVLLRLFIIASGLILLSAAWRLSLYVGYYGLSYEKFFASYTILFAILVFTKLILATWSNRRLNVSPAIILLALWFFSIATVLPIEKIIFYTNIQLADIPSSRIDLSELTALSLDVGADVVQYMDVGVLRDSQWFRWKMNYLNQECLRPLYHMNLSSILNCNAMKLR